MFLKKIKKAQAVSTKDQRHFKAKPSAGIIKMCRHAWGDEKTCFSFNI